jgi:cullin 3
VGDSFSFNVDFSAPLQKIKISTVAARVEDADERKETKDRVDEERRHQMDVSSFRYLQRASTLTDDVCLRRHASSG